MTGKCTTAVMMHDVPYKKDDFMTEDYKGLSGSEVSQRVEAGKVNTTTNSISRTKKEIFGRIYVRSLTSECFSRCTCSDDRTD